MARVVVGWVGIGIRCIDLVVDKRGLGFDLCYCTGTGNKASRTGIL